MKQKRVEHPEKDFHDLSSSTDELILGLEGQWQPLGPRSEGRAGKIKTYEDNVKHFSRGPRLGGESSA